ncbi:MAG: hypothetical protein K2Y35_10830 [Burkholderiales bacterium]|nr:hypothetical protein [Burkholderiales bacterium]
MFYAFWKVEYALIMVVLTIVDFFAGKRIAAAPTLRARRAWLAGSIAANLSMLFFFKYYNFGAAQVNELIARSGLSGHVPLADIVLPLGISFHTFQAMSYTLDVYHKRVKPENHLGYFALFIAYFPQIVAGPIERAGHLIHQLRQRASFSYAQARDGFLLILIGFFKKLVIADNLAVYVDRCYGSWEEVSGSSLLLATYAFAFQIYADFSGYTDIARGSAKLLGVDLAVNFRSPYLADGVADFWRRWHISLTSWFRDYVYKPLRSTQAWGGRTAAVFIVFALSGIWHGANWTFLVWGLLNACFYLLNEALTALFPRTLGMRALKPLRIFLTFNLIAITWVFFRADSVTSAVGILTKIEEHYVFGLMAGRWVKDTLGYLNVGMLASLLLLVVEHFWHGSDALRQRFAASTAARWTAYLALFYSTLLLGNLGAKQFIYFQF